MDFKELFTPAAIAANWNEVYSNQIPYLGAGLFPARKKAGLDLAWFKGSKGLPVSLMPSTFDAQATFRDRIGLEKLETEMPFFREGFKIKEKDRQELLRAAEASDPSAEAILARIYDDANELIAGAEVVAERMRMQLLFPVDGELGISIKANGVDYTYEYDADDSWKGTNYTALSGTALWSAAATATPIADIQRAKKAIRAATGSEVAIAIMNDTTLEYMLACNEVINRFKTYNPTIVSAVTTDEELIAVIESALKIRILAYNKMFKDEDKVAHTFVPDGYVSLIPSGALGATWYGTTPEEADGAGAPMDVSIVNTGVAISRIVEPHPVNVNTIASEIVLPSFERVDEVAALKVLA